MNWLPNSLIAATITTAALIGTALLLHAQTADCFNCFNIMCFSSDVCGDGCACAMEIFDPSGTCVSVRAIPPGQSVLP